MFGLTDGWWLTARIHTDGHGQDAHDGGPRARGPGGARDHSPVHTCWYHSVNPFHAFTRITESPPPHTHTHSSFQHIFSRVAAADHAGQQFLVRASYLEIYNEEVRDLLAKDPR